MELNEREIKLVEELKRVMVEEYELEQDTAKKKLENIVSEKLFGPGLVDKRVNVKWGSLFAKSLCPVCNEKLSKVEKDYTCAKCGLRIPMELYKKAGEQHKKEVERDEKEFKIRERMEEMKLPEETMGEIYKIALERSEAEQSRMEKKEDET